MTSAAIVILPAAAVLPQTDKPKHKVFVREWSGQECPDYRGWGNNERVTDEITNIITGEIANPTDRRDIPVPSISMRHAILPERRLMDENFMLGVIVTGWIRDQFGLK